MKKLLAVILALLVLGPVVPGCGSTHRYDGRLAAVDSLMKDNPDSALALVLALDTADILAEGDRAYRALLLTQARYKSYVTATSDSDINQALAYFRAHPADREKLTRAYIYKGAVMNELGHPDSAMKNFKVAEETAAPDDYFNLGYAKMQMGGLYNDYYTIGGQETVKYEEALECFKKTKDSLYILICLNNLGCMYRETMPKKAESMLLEASSLARDLHDTIRMNYNNLSLVVHYFYQGRYEEARQRIWETSTFDANKSDFKAHFTAANVYARLSILDTAELYINLARQNCSDDGPLYRMYYLQSLSELALAKRDTVASIRLGLESQRIEDSLKSDNKKLEILHVEVSHDKETVTKKQNAHKNTISSYQWLIALLALVIVFLPVFLYRRAHHYDKLIQELKEENKNQSIDLKTLQQNINELKINDIELKGFIFSHIDMMCKVIEECYHLPQGPLSKEIRKIVRFQDKKSGIWSKLYKYLDLQYNNIMSETKERFPQLEEKDLLMIALTCMGYSCAQIAIVLDYSSSSGISTIRKRIAEKMGLECLLGEYIEQYKSKN